MGRASGYARGRGCNLLCAVILMFSKMCWALHFAEKECRESQNDICIDHYSICILNVNI